MNKFIIFLFSACLLCFSCSSKQKKKSNEIDLNRSTEITNNSEENGLREKEEIHTRPNTVLLTLNANHRLMTIYKEKYNYNGTRVYIEGNYFHRTYYNDFEDEKNAWHNHFMPGIEAVYGYDMYNVSHYNTETKERKIFFDNPVVINTLYYPAFEQDTLNNVPVKRNFYLVSAYDEDTNNDTIINHKDLRKLFYFDGEAKNKTLLIPADYSVQSSEYDPQNDYMYIFAKQDTNKNGARENEEPIHVFLLDLKSPTKADRMY